MSNVIQAAPGVCTTSIKKIHGLKCKTGPIEKKRTHQEGPHAIFGSTIVIRQTQGYFHGILVMLTCCAGCRMVSSSLVHSAARACSGSLTRMSGHSLQQRTSNSRSNSRSLLLNQGLVHTRVWRRKSVPLPTIQSETWLVHVKVREPAMFQIGL